jgi:diguanylate cyclase (GGDEF)-like protein
LEFALTREVLASLYGQTPTPTILCDRQGRILSANAAAEQLFQHALHEMAGTPCGELLDAGDLEQVLSRATCGEGSTLEASFEKSSGERLLLRCDVFPASLGDDAVAAFIQLRRQDAAFGDPVTGLPNRLVLEDRLEQNLVTARRYSYRFALVHADVDGFSEIVARLGASGANDVLRIAAERMREPLRRSDTVARTGTDKFAVLLPMIEEVEDAIDLVHRIIFAMSAPMDVSGAALDVRLSHGIAIYPSDGETREELTRGADRALREAKKRARGLFWIASPQATEPAT